MPKYLSEEWHKEFQRLWNDLLPDRPGTSARTQNKITGGPDGDQAYYWVIRDGKLSEAMVGESPDSEVTITTGYVDSVKIQKGELDPNAAFMQGRMKVSGNVAKQEDTPPFSWQDPGQHRQQPTIGIAVAKTRNLARQMAN